jgi:hypothetical protein
MEHMNGACVTMDNLPLTEPSHLLSQFHEFINEEMGC